KNPDGYGASVRDRLEWSMKITSDEYVRGLRERELLRRDVANFFRGVDALLLPSMPCSAAPIATLMATINGNEYPCLWIHRQGYSLPLMVAISVAIGAALHGIDGSRSASTPRKKFATSRRSSSRSRKPRTYSSDVIFIDH